MERSNSQLAQLQVIGTNSEVRLSSKFSSGRFSNAYDAINKRGGPLQTGSSLIVLPSRSKPFLKSFYDVNEDAGKVRVQNYSTINNESNDPYGNNFGIKNPSMNRGSSKKLGSENGFLSKHRSSYSVASSNGINLLMEAKNAQAQQIKVDGAKSVGLRSHNSRRSQIRASIDFSVDARKNLNQSTIDEVKSVMSAKTQKKLFGNLSVKDIVKYNNRSLLSDDGLGIKGYHYDPSLRFNFNRNHKVPAEKMKRVFDVIINREKKLPGPSSYSNTVHKTNFNDITKKSKILTFDRKSAIPMIANSAKWIPGIGKYNVETYDLKREKPAKGTYTQHAQRITFQDEAMIRGKEAPKIYEPTKLDLFHPKPVQVVRYHKETDVQVKQKGRQTKKNDSPSPTGYKTVVEGYEKLSGSPSHDKGGRYYKIQKAKNQTIFDQIIKKGKELPGVGKYKNEIALDKSARPMRPSRN